MSYPALVFSLLPVLPLFIPSIPFSSLYCPSLFFPTFSSIVSFTLFNFCSRQARGEVIASISTISSVEDFVVPARELERRLLELCMAEILTDIERSGQTGVKETNSALQVIKLLDDFIFTSGNFIETLV